MVEALDDGSLDVAVMLTEGAVAAFAAGAAFDIEHVYVVSPLQWGIHVPAASSLCEEASIRGKRYAISRRGSGSHLMSYAHARAHGWPLEQLEFVVVGTLDGAIEAFRQGRADVFFWERYMTAPLVEAGQWRRVGIFEAPWPAFVVCLAKRLDRDRRQAFAELYAQVLRAAQTFASDAEGTAARVSEAFGIDRDAVAQWLAETRFAGAPGIEKQMLERVAAVLSDADLIETIPEF